ncbi:MAG: VPLPA-CTERM sorting domain-containing protein [Steroidobacteraceae bacterium]
MKTMNRMRPSVKLGLLAPLVLTCLSVAPHAWADSVLLAQTTLVDGSEATTDSFVAPSAGTITVNLQNQQWAGPLTALSFSASSASQVLASFNATGLSSDTATFNVGPGTYFANIMATAGGSMDLGLYSLMMTFSPTSMPTVPLPSSGWLLLTGLFVLAGLARVVRPLEWMGTAQA